MLQVHTEANLIRRVRVQLCKRRQVHRAQQRSSWWLMSCGRAALSSLDITTKTTVKTGTVQSLSNISASFQTRAPYRDPSSLFTYPFIAKSCVRLGRGNWFHLIALVVVFLAHILETESHSKYLVTHHHCSGSSRVNDTPSSLETPEHDRWDWITGRLV